MMLSMSSFSSLDLEEGSQGMGMTAKRTIFPGTRRIAAYCAVSAGPSH
jgi:hypothetical protein